MLQDKPEEVDHGYLLSRSLDVCGEQPTWDALRKAGAANLSIANYRVSEEMNHSDTGGQSAEITSLSYEELLNKLPTGPTLLWRWGQHAKR